MCEDILCKDYPICKEQVDAEKDTCSIPSCFKPPQPAQDEEPSLGELVCFDCKEPYAVPFDNGDGEVRCAACAVDKYMRLPGATVVLTEKVFKICGS